MFDVEPSKTAVLLMDLQHNLVARHATDPAYLPNILRARDAARLAGMTVGYVRVALTAVEAAEVPPHSRFASVAARGATADEPTSQLVSHLAPEPDEIVVRKRRIGAFRTTDLHERLRVRGVDTLVLAGISTSGAVLSTVRDATDLDYRIVVLSDGCLDTDPEVHRMLMEKIFPRGGVHVIQIAEFVVQAAVAAAGSVARV